MGGHGHGELPYKIPSAATYKIDGIPQLEQVQKALARQGLRDPWLRNEVWRYDPKIQGTHASRARAFFGRGFLLGSALFATTIAVEYALGAGGDHHEEGHGHH